MFCNTASSSQSPLSCDSYRVANVVLYVERVLYCTACVEQAKAKYVDALVKVKMFPAKLSQALALSQVELRVKRSDGTMSKGLLHAEYTLGFSQSANEITAWVLLPDTMQMKPLLLSLLLAENPELLSYFQHGLKIEFDAGCEEIFKKDFPQFLDKVEKSLTVLNQQFF
jgi:hypothetical protein